MRAQGRECAKLFDGMKAVVISHPGPPDVLKIEERPKPSLEAAEVLIRVKAAGLNRADLIQREGRYPAPPDAPADIPGLEVAGVIEKAGADVRRWKIGDAVCALLAGGGYAEYVAVKAGHCLPVPGDGVSRKRRRYPKRCSPFGTTYFNAGDFNAGERFLVHGGSSGIGLAAIQLARAHRGASVRDRRERREMPGLRGGGRRARDQLPQRRFRDGAER